MLLTKGDKIIIWGDSNEFNQLVHYFSMKGIAYSTIANFVLVVHDNVDIEDLDLIPIEVDIYGKCYEVQGEIPNSISRRN